MVTSPLTRPDGIRTKIPHAYCEGRKGAPRGDGIHLGNGRFQPRSLTITRPTLELESS
jgi:hypothetical protein